MPGLDGLPENLQDTATAEALRAICDLDLSELQAIMGSPHDLYKIVR